VLLVHVVGKRRKEPALLMMLVFGLLVAGGDAAARLRRSISTAFTPVVDSPKVSNLLLSCLTVSLVKSSCVFSTSCCATGDAGRSVVILVVVRRLLLIAAPTRFFPGISIK